MKKFLIVPAVIALSFFNLAAQTRVSVREFTPMCDSLSKLIKERTTVEAALKLKSVTLRGQTLQFNFTESLSDIPWKEKDAKWFRKELERLLPEKYSGCSVGAVYGKSLRIEELVTPELHSDGRPHGSRFRVNDPKGLYEPLVERIGDKKYHRGLSGRYIALWQSHGRYYETKTSRWEWQRAQDFTTVEDMYTQSYVIPFLIPMLENAGAYVMTPRERDTQRNEAVVDNDPSFSESRTGGLRKSGEYKEKGQWKDAGVGFADLKAAYTGNDNPFTMGTARMSECEEQATASVKWTPDIPERGEYAVYISYKTLPKSTRSAHYTVSHLGGETEFIVNQQMGGGTWIYLGTFVFGESGGCVTLDNGTPGGRRFTHGSVVTADAVRFGGGMGKIARGDDGAPLSEYTVSGLPSYTEGALYNMQWGGVDSTILKAHEGDYTNDYADRGAWVGLMSGGSRVNPEAEGKGIPVDLSLAFHTDAGVTPNDSIVGTLGIYTLLCDKKRTLPDGEDRLVCREYVDYVQSQIVNDIRKEFNPEWSRRQIWDRSYSESRTTGVPAMLLELLSHQNFADMRFGLDPGFRFTVSRAVYKGILKFLSNRYGCPYTVQPLPVGSFAAELGGGSTVTLSWKATKDTLEETASPKGYILYTRIDDGTFDDGKIIEDVRVSGDRFYTDVPTAPGHIFSFKIEAFNEGGRSFPSEILSAGRPKTQSGESPVLIVNNFHRVSGPAWFDTPSYAGFDLSLDRGVPYLKDISYIGDMYQFRRTLPWLDDDNPGFGGSYSDEAGKQFAGNSFDYPYIHGKAILELGRAFCSASSDAFSECRTLRENFKSVDIICGKEVTTATGTGTAPPKYMVFPENFQSAIREFTSSGGNVLISGANIGTDIWDEVYPVPHDSLKREEAKAFVMQILGYKWLTNYASRLGEVRVMKNSTMDISPSDGTIKYHSVPNEEIYNVETPDGILPSDSSKGGVFLRYADTGIPCGVFFNGPGYKVVSLGFPIETISTEDGIKAVIGSALRFFTSK